MVGGKPGQGHRSRSERRAAPTQPSPDTPQRVELVGAGGCLDVGQGGEQCRLGDGVGHRLEGGRQAVPWRRAPAVSTTAPVSATP